MCGGAGARNRRTLLVARGADNFGSGLFLPLALVYVTRDVSLPPAAAGMLVWLGTLRAWPRPGAWDADRREACGTVGAGGGSLGSR